MTNPATTKRIAVLIDGENISPDHADALFRSIADLGDATIRRLYGNFSVGNGWMAKAEQHAITRRHLFPNAKSKKNAADIALVVEAMDLLHMAKVDAFCIASSDSDFTGLALRLREDGMTVYGFGQDKATAPFRHACHRFFELGAKTAPSTDDARMAKVRELLTQAMARLGSGPTEVTLGVLGYQVRQVDRDFDTKQYGAKNLKTLVQRAGLRLVGEGVSSKVVVPPQTVRSDGQGPAKLQRPPRSGRSAS